MADKIIAGNWKMNLTATDAMQLVKDLNTYNTPADVRVLVFPSSLYTGIASAFSKNVEVGVQNFSEYSNGAYTGENSIAQSISVGATIGLIGHSERRAYFKEDSDTLKAKVSKAVEENFEFIFCCGEPLFIREEGAELEFVRQQLEDSLFHLSAEQMKNRIIAYEPVWALGTGKTASSEQAEDMHRNIRSWLTEKYNDDVANSVSILYGGSCKPSNAKELFSCPNVDGGLIGGASLNAEDFSALINSF